MIDTKISRYYLTLVKTHKCSQSPKCVYKYGNPNLIFKSINLVSSIFFEVNLPTPFSFAHFSIGLIIINIDI